MQRALDVPVLCRVLPPLPSAQRFAKHPLQCFDITDYNKSGFICLHDCLTQRQTHGRTDRQTERVSDVLTERLSVGQTVAARQEWRGMSVAFISLCSGIASAVYHMSTCSLTSLLIMSFKRFRLPQHLFLCTTRVGVCAWMCVICTQIFVVVRAHGRVRVAMGIKHLIRIIL